jgi:hypothetical protein
VVSTTLRSLLPRESLGTHCTGGWVGPRTGLDVCEKSRPQWIFFFIALVSSVSCTVCSSVLFVSYRTACCGFFHYEKSDGSGRERTRDLGFQRPARKPLDHRSRCIRSPDRPARSQSLYRLRYSDHLIMHGKVIPLQVLTGLERFRKLRLTDFEDNRQMKVARLSALRTGRFYPRKYSWFSFLLEAESTPGPQCGRKNYVNGKFQ